MNDKEQKPSGFTKKNEDSSDSLSGEGKTQHSLARIEASQVKASELEADNNAAARQQHNRREADLGLDVTGPKKFGLTLLFAVFGVFGIWAAVAPLDGAARAPGQVTVKSHKKLVQHLEGGIVGNIFVQDGDLVQAGDLLLELDNTQSLTQLERATTQFIASKAREARLIAERDRLGDIRFPVEWSSQNAAENDEMIAQSAIFKSRQASLNGRIEVLEQRTEQLESRLVGLHALRQSKEALAKSFADELEDVKSLLSQGFSEKTKLRSIERSLASYQGESAELLATISSTEVEIGEASLQILQLEREFQNEIVLELSDAQTRLKDIVETITALEDVVSRTKIESPASGIINGMQAHTVGGIITAGNPIAEVVPLSEELILEARVSAIDIDRVFTGQQARIRFSSFGGKTPEIFGNLLSLSADAFQDETTGQPYYLARIEVTSESLENLNGLELLPGMPAEAFIATGSRTLLQYLIKPFSNTVARSFIED